MENKRKENEPGLAVDVSGNSVIDPTKNVLNLVEAAVRRADDLSEVNSKYFEARLGWIEQAAQLRAQHNADNAKLRAENQVALDDKESKRLDSVRMVDQLAVKTESDRSAAAITALASAAGITAETLRSAVNTSAANLATQLDRTVSAITERIASLEKSSYTGAGRAGVADPQIERLATMVEQLSRSNNTNAGKIQGVNAVWILVMGAVSLISGLAGVIGVVFALMKSPNQVPVQTPQTIYLAAPSPGTLPMTTTTPSSTTTTVPIR